MRIVNKIWFLMIIFSLWSCAKENDDYIFTHDSNTISQMICKASHSSGEFSGEITEFDENGKIVDGNFEQKDIEGGYGLIIFYVPKSLEKDIDLSNVFLMATVTYDAIITPTLSGKHDVTGDGIIITVTSGTGTERQYRVRGVYE